MASLPALTRRTMHRLARHDLQRLKQVCCALALSKTSAHLRAPVHRTLACHPAVVGIPDEKWGERPLLVVVKKPGGAGASGDHAADSAALKEQLLVFLEGKIARCVISKVSSSRQVRDLKSRTDPGTQ